METIEIPSECVLDLIKLDICSFYDRNSYKDLTVKVISSGYSSLSEDTIILNRKDLSILLFNRVVRCDSFWLSVSF
jgi:hypothetical protein